MTKAMFAKTLNGTLAPVDGTASDFITRLPAGKEVWVDVTRARNPRRFRLFWALVQIVRENTDCHQSKEGVGDYLKVLGGHVEVFKRPSGEIVEVAKSIAWSKLSEEEFSAFITRLMNVICTEVIPGLPESDLKRELEAITEIKTERTL